MLTRMPLAGGSTTLSWRWACEYRIDVKLFILLNVSQVYLNLPVCLVGYIVLLVSLRHVEFNRAKSASWRTFVQKFDFVGL
jgi:hypothetical protein